MKFEKFEYGPIEKIRVSFSFASNRFELEGEGIDLTLSIEAMQSLMRQIESLGFESIIENLHDAGYY